MNPAPSLYSNSKVLPRSTGNEKNITERRCGVKKIIFILIALLLATLIAGQCLANRAIIPARGKVNSFGMYSFIGKLDFDVKKPGEQEIGKIVIEGAYNGEYPWIMRVYTDNTNYTGVAGSVRAQSPAGLISTDGRFSLPLLLDSPAMLLAGYRAVPDINQPGYKTYIPDKINRAMPYTDCIIMAIDPRNEVWVAGENGKLFDGDDNTIGDMTANTPVEIKFKAKFNEEAVAANYTANLYIEIVACP